MTARSPVVSLLPQPLEHWQATHERALLSVGSIPDCKTHSLAIGRWVLLITVWEGLSLSLQ